MKIEDALPLWDEQFRLKTFRHKMSKGNIASCEARIKLLKEKVNNNDK